MIPIGCRRLWSPKNIRKGKSDRPEHTPPELWQKATPKPRAQWIEEALEKTEAPPAPAMLVVCMGPWPRPRRPKVSRPVPHFGFSMVARTVGKREAQTSAESQAAFRLEWDSLRWLGTWDEAEVREWSDVSKEAIAKKIRVHVGRIFARVVERNVKLVGHNPLKELKARAVFQGNKLKDESSYEAFFQDLGSALASMPAAKFVDYLLC